MTASPEAFFYLFLAAALGYGVCDLIRDSRAQRERLRREEIESNARNGTRYRFFE